jgi:hypothetical protein
MGYQSVRNEPGRLIVSPKKWVDITNAIGIYSKPGRYGGGIFAHRDIALEFGTWLSAEFKYYLILEFNRLKAKEQQRLAHPTRFVARRTADSAQSDCDHTIITPATNSRNKVPRVSADMRGGETAHTAASRR